MARKNEADWNRKARLKSRYGITIEEFDRLEFLQGGKCAICRNPETSVYGGGRNPELAGTTRRLSVDHDHTTGVVRGLLCQKCNAGLGQFQDSTELLSEAIDYLSITNMPRISPG